MFGELIPVGGGDPIPLLKQKLMVGRRESCDVVLRFPNVSAHHCELYIDGGYWYVKDLNSRNGTKVNKVRVAERLLKPKDVVSIAKHKYEISYEPTSLGAMGPPPDEDGVDFDRSLLDRAGLSPVRRKASRPVRHDPTFDELAIREDDEEDDD